jgi:hypothetical protein
MATQEKLGEAYNSEFYDAIADNSRASAKVVLPLVREMVNPASVLDVGCGVGG